MPNQNTAQVIVIGGGVVGASITYSLARTGVSVILLERDGLASGTAGATDGYVVYHTKKAGIHLELAIASGKMFESLSEEIRDISGVDIEYEKNCGSMQVLDNEAEWPFVEKMVKEQRESTGLDIAMYSIEELRKIEPALNPALIGGLYSPTGGKVNPFRLVQGLAASAKKFGAKVYEGTPVTGIIKEGDTVKGVHTPKGDFYADYTINACGTWGGEIAKMAGLDYPIKPRRGQILVTEPVMPLVHCTMQCGRTTAIKLNPKMLELLDAEIVKMGMGFCLEQTQDGSFLIGFTREFAGFDKRTTLKAMELIAARAIKYIPALKNMNIIRSFSGLRPYTPDGLPLLGMPKDIKGFVMAAGHEGDGICLGPITGKLITELLTTQTTSYPLDKFACDRFSN